VVVQEGMRAGSDVGVQSFYRARQVNAVLSDTVPSQSVRDHAASSLTNLDGHIRLGRSVSGRAGGKRSGTVYVRSRSHAASVHSTGARVSTRGGNMTGAQGGTRGAFRGRRAVTQRRAKSANMRLTKPGYGNAGFENLTDEVGYQNWMKPFDETVGYQWDRELSNANTALDDDFWNLLTLKTNRYAHQFLASHEIKPHSRFHQWSDVTVSEIKAFMSLHLSMGLVEKAELEDYWADYWPTVM